MAITKIKVSNFKSFRDIDIELGPLTILIGANASGKSNFIRIFEFLRDIANHGLVNAISMQGGVEYLRNMNLGPSQPLSTAIVSDWKFRFRVPSERGAVFFNSEKTHYRFGLSFSRRGREFQISEDNLVQEGKFTEFKENKSETRVPGKISVWSDRGKAQCSLDVPTAVRIKEEDIAYWFASQRIPPIGLILGERMIYATYGLTSVFGPAAIYDFDPKLPKKATPITGKADLEEDGSNLSLVLKNIVEDKEKKRRFSNLIKDLLPFVSSLRVEKFADKSLLFALREKYLSNQELPAAFISDGTINIAALIVALYFEQRPLAIIEEPERNIHPYLISKVVGMMKEASKTKQIIVTTHNPEMVKHADLDSLVLVARDKEGFSILTRPAEKEHVKTFLANEMGMDDLYVQNLLEL